MKRTLALCLCLLLLTPAVRAQEPSGNNLDLQLAGRYGKLALKCVHRQYPSKISHLLRSRNDARTPKELTPVFYGCYDWHSAVHGHWMLARIARLFPGTPIAKQARQALDRSLTAEGVAKELAYLKAPGREDFERPYGLAWLLQLGAELREWNTPEARRWSKILAPLEQLVVKRLEAWLPKLSRPIRSGDHHQTAFALGLALDWARVAGAADFEKLVSQTAQRLFDDDSACLLEYEPSGEDFLSPCLAEADLLRRILPSDRFAAWLAGFLPSIPADGSDGWLAPAIVTDRSDAKRVHLDGLNLSRAWMLEGIASALPAGDPRLGALREAAWHHRLSGLAAVNGLFYEGGHWLGSFAVYLMSGRGLEPPASIAAADAEARVE